MSEIDIVSAKSCHSKIIWAWRNDPITRKMSNNNAKISWEDHSCWYEKTLLNINSDLNVFSKACPLFVPLTEEGWISGDVPKSIAETYLKEIKESNVDTVILGCTHYPLIKPIISQILGIKIKLIDSGKASTEFVEETLRTEGIKADSNNTRRINCYVTDSIKPFSVLAGKFLSFPINSIKHIEIF